MSTLVPSAIMVRGGQRDSKTRQTEDRPEHAVPEEGRRDERPGETGRLGFRVRVGVAIGTRKTEVWLVGKREKGQQTNPSLKHREMIQFGNFLGYASSE